MKKLLGHWVYSFVFHHHQIKWNHLTRQVMIIDLQKDPMMFNIHNQFLCSAYNFFRSIFHVNWFTSNIRPKTFSSNLEIAFAFRFSVSFNAIRFTFFTLSNGFILFQYHMTDWAIIKVKAIVCWQLMRKKGRIL